MADIDYDKLSDSIARAIGPRASTTPPAGGSGGKFDNASGSGVISGLIDDLGKLRNGASATGTVLTGIADTLGAVYKPLGQIAGQSAQQLQGTVQSMSQLNQQGANLGNNIANYNTKLAEAGTTPEKFSQMWSQFGPKLQGLGETQGQAADRVLTAMKEFKEKYGEQLTTMGLNNDQQAEYFAKYLADRKFTDISDKKSRQALIDEAGLNAQKLNEYAQTVGKSTAELQKEQMAGEDDVNVQAEILKGGKESVEAFARVKSGLADMGPGIKSLANEILTGGIRTAEGSAKFAALGPAGAQLEKALMDQKNAKTTEQKIAADAALQTAKNRADEYMRSKEFLTNVQNDKSEVGQAQAQFLKENANRLASTIQSQQALEKQGKPADIEAAKARQSNIAQANIQGIDPTTGKKNKSAEAYEAAVKMDASGQNAAIGAAAKITAGSITTLGTAAETTAGKILSKYRSPGEVNNALSGTGGKELPPRKTLEPQKTRDTGTLGMTGSLFEKEDFYGKVQKGETVLTPDQLTNLVKGVQTSSMPDLSNIKTPPASQAGTMPNLSNVKAPPAINPDSFKSVFSDMQKNMKMPQGLEKIAGGIPNMKDMFAGIQTKISGIATQAKDDRDSAQKTAVEAPAISTPEPVTPDVGSAPTSAEPTQKEMLEALNSLNKMMGELVSLQGTNNNIAEGMERKISSNNRFVA